MVTRTTEPLGFYQTWRVRAQDSPQRLKRFIDGVAPFLTKFTDILQRGRNVKTFDPLNRSVISLDHNQVKMVVPRSLSTR